MQIQLNKTGKERFNQIGIGLIRKILEYILSYFKLSYPNDKSLL